MAESRLERNAIKNAENSASVRDSGYHPLTIECWEDTTMAASAAIHVRAPDAIVNGKSIADWTENWWQWALQAPSSDGPLTSGSPEATHYNNDGKVFFIAGGHDATIAVPAGKPILFPMVNAFATEGQAQYVQDIPGFYPSRGTLADEAAYVTNLTQNSIDDAYATLTSGGRTLLSVHWPESSNYAEESGVFALGAPKPGSYLASLVNGLDISDVPNLPNTSSSGDWLMLGPLPPGRYTLDFGGHIGTVIDPVSGDTLSTGNYTTHTQDTLIVGPAAKA